MDKFKQMAGPTIVEHGGKVLVCEPSLDVREGENLGTVVLIEFESIDAARKFYESEKYQAAIVRAVGQIELLFSYISSRYYFKEKIRLIEIIGIIVFAIGVILILTAK